MATPGPSAGRLRLLQLLTLAAAPLASRDADAHVTTTFVDLLDARDAMLSSPDDPAAGARYREARTSFERSEGDLVDLYPGKARSGVAITRTRRSGGRLRLHRVSDELTRDAPGIAGTIQDWSILAVRTRSLRGANAEMLMRWIFAATTYLIGLVAAAPAGTLDRKTEAAVRAAHAKQLATATAYYEANASYCAYVDYFWGMILGVFSNAAVAIGCVEFVNLLVPRIWDGVSVADTLQAQAFGAIAAGAIGSLLSVTLRMAEGKFQVNHDVGRMELVIIGSFRPFIGAASGLAVYLALGAGILKGSIGHADFFVIAITAFVAGFSERFAKGAFARAENVMVPSASGDEAAGRAGGGG